MKKNLLLILICTLLLTYFTGCVSRVKEEGEIKTREEFIENIKNIKKIEVFAANNKKIQTISKQEDLNKISDMISNTQELDENVEDEGNTWFISIYNKNNELVGNVSVWRRGYLGFGKKMEKEYKVDINDIDAFEKLLEK